MKFAKELEDDLVPEWRAKYINYKLGKKKIKAISRALRSANRTPRIAGRPPLIHSDSAASIPYTHYDFNSRNDRKVRYGGTSNLLDGTSVHRTNAYGPLPDTRRMSTTMFAASPPVQQPDSRGSSSEGEEVFEESDGERTPLKRTESSYVDEETPTSYGSFSPGGVVSTGTLPGRMPRLSLPDPALDPGRERTQSPGLVPLQTQRPQPEHGGRVVQMQEPEKPEPPKHHSQPLMKRIVQRKMGQPRDKMQNAQSTKPSARDRWRKAFSAKKLDSPQITTTQQNAYQELDIRQDDFFDFLDKELDKIEKFYKLKEDEARDRLNVLRAQLHEHRDQRARDIEHERQGQHDLVGQGHAISNGPTNTPFPNASKKEGHEAAPNGGILKKVLKNESKIGKIGKTSKAMEDLASPPASPQTRANNDWKDYTRRRQPTAGNENVPHRFAKRRLKLALQEFYRGMELLKSYAMLNRTGFRKINKKYDKAVNARPPLRYLNEKVSRAHFVRSTLIDEYLVAVEDLYARYFERGNRKVAVNRLRSQLRAGDHSGSTFRNGLYLAAGAGLGVAGLYNAGELLFHGTQRTTTSYLLQMYAGYFLALLLFLIFILDCKIWTNARINYIFVFEYDTRHVLDWRQLAEIPCFFLFLNGLFIWLNFEFGDTGTMYKYWPVLLYGLTLTIMALPFKVLYYHSRKWWGVSNFRLLFAGLYPVEFRDFFLGDMYCSETYAMSQMEVFFCAYRWDFRNPARCNSNHSHLLGFFTCLPAIWRFLQCIRRYYDSRNWFPHLANCAKYMCNILYYMTLSLYRLHIDTPLRSRYRITFIAFAALNGIYCSLWDVFMDWSLGDVFSKHFGLRNHLAYRRPWVYWAAIVWNTILRHQWIFYAIFTQDLQHSAIMSFFVGLAEVLRRGVWVLFRVENEHTNNVKNFRASRDIPLPYRLPSESRVHITTPQEEAELRRRRPVSSDLSRAPLEGVGTTTGTDYDLERQVTAESTSSLRRRLSNTPALRALQRVGTVIAAAHSQDYLKRRRPEVVGDSPADESMLEDQGGAYSSEEDDEDEDDRHDEIEWSIMGDDAEERHAGHRDGLPQQDHDDSGEGSSSDSQGPRQRAGNTRVHNEGDIDEARQLADAYSPQEGLRGGESSKTK